MKVIETAYISDTQVFLFKNQVIGCVNGNDGKWRHEYFNPIFEQVGVTVRPRKKPLTRAHLIACEEFGCEFNGEEYGD